MYNEKADGGSVRLILENIFFWHWCRVLVRLDWRASRRQRRIILIHRYIHIDICIYIYVYIRGSMALGLYGKVLPYGAGTSSIFDFGGCFINKTAQGGPTRAQGGPQGPGPQGTGGGHKGQIMNLSNLARRLRPCRRASRRRP